MELKIIDDLIGGMPSWTEEANCKGADADLFFPERGASTRKAKAICRACTVQDECLEYAVEQSEKFGIWGGLSERPPQIPNFSDCSTAYSRHSS